MTPDELVADESQKVGRPLELVAAHVFNDRHTDSRALYVIVQSAIPTPDGTMREMRFIVATPNNRQTSRTSGIIKTWFDEEAATKREP